MMRGQGFLTKDVPVFRPDFLSNCLLGAGSWIVDWLWA